MTQVEQRFRCASEELGVRRDLDVGNAVNGYVDELVGGNSLTRLYVNLHNAQGETVNTGKERHTPAGFTNQNFLFAKTCDDVSGVRRCFEIAADAKNSNKCKHDENGNQKFHSVSPFQK